ncbi:MAG: C1 family peptidase [Lachnospiraceae bacterium]|nr:C1 family peptidase [Lachnospiraceae bacterium]
MSAFQGISEKELSAFHGSYAGSPLCRAVTNALYKTAVNDISFRPSARKDVQFTFSVDLPTMKVTNQKASGRCWIFAALNVLREQVAKNCNIEQFELSQNYMAFWDKFEKANFFLESVISLADRPSDDRLLSFIEDTGIADGGQWDMFVNLVRKYGVIPKAAMEETFQSSNTRQMNRLVNTKLRQTAARIRKAYRNGATEQDLHGIRITALDELYRIFCMCFGEPPKTFDFEYRDKDKNYHIDRGLNAKAFYDKYVGLDLENDFVSLVNSPTEDKPFYRTFAIDYLGNVADGRPVHYLNIPMEDLKSLIIAQLKDGEIVWFGSDVGHSGERDLGIWSRGCFDFDGTFGMSFGMTKEERLNNRESAMSHAMCVTGVSLDENGAPVKWKIENSCSEEHGDKGDYIMDDEWFDNFVYQAVIRRKYLGEKLLAALGTKPLHFFPWDPMGTLAD